MSRTLVCAIQIGTSRICAAAAWRDQNGSYEIAAIEQEPTSGCVRRGCIVDVDQAAAHIKTLVQKLSSRVKSECPGIDAAYVGIGGISMHSTPFHPNVEIEDGRSIDGNIIAALRQKSRQFFIPGYDIIGIETAGYTLDDVECINPEGRTGSLLVAHHQLVVAQKRLRLELRSVMDKAGLRMIDVLATPLCLANILTPDEKQRGCVLIDFGHSLTTVSVYADGALQYLATIPLGSNAVTLDIASNKGITWEEAEESKRRMDKLDLVVRCRLEEIANNIRHQIEQSGCFDKITAGCVLSGGASMQRELVTVLSETLGINRLVVRAYSGVVSGVSDRKPQLAALMTMIPFCTANCSMESRKAKMLEAERMKNQDQLELFAEDEEPAGQENVAASETEDAAEEQPATEEKKDDEPFIKTPRKSGLSRFFNDLFSGIDE